MPKDTIFTAGEMSQIEALLVEYTLEFDHAILKNQKLRGLKCGFCGYNFKYQNALNYHIFNKHMVDLKDITDSERRLFIRFYLDDDRDITYAQFHKEYFAQKNSFSLYLDEWKNLKASDYHVISPNKLIH